MRPSRGNDIRPGEAIFVVSGKWGFDGAVELLVFEGDPPVLYRMLRMAPLTAEMS